MVSPVLLLFACNGSEGRLNVITRVEEAIPSEEIEEIGRDFPALAADGALEDATDDDTNGAHLFAEGVIQDLNIDLSDDAVAALRLAPKEDVAGGLTWRGRRYPSAVRIKGSASLRTIDEKPSFKIDVHEYDPEQRIDGQKRLILNNMVQDRSMLREHAYYWLAAKVGVPAPRHSYARVWVNGQYYGLYGLIECEDGQLADRLWPDDPDGNIYEASGADFTEERDWFELEQDGGVAAAPDDVNALVTDIANTPVDDFDRLLSERFDEDAVLSYFALEVVVGNDDGYVFNHHNYRVYHAPLADKWSLLPWGTDRSFKVHSPPDGTALDPIVGILTIDCEANAACDSWLRDHMLRVLDAWDAGLDQYIADTAALIATDCQNDPRKENPCNPADLTNFTDSRPAELRAILE